MKEKKMMNIRDSGIAGEVSDWLRSSFALVCARLRIVLNASHLRDFHLGIYPIMSTVYFNRDAFAPYTRLTEKQNKIKYTSTTFDFRVSRRAQSSNKRMIPT